MGWTEDGRVVRPLLTVEAPASTVEWLDVCKLIRPAVKALEVLIERTPPGSRRHAELTVAWHNLLDAHKLLMTGRMTPETLVWARGVAQKIATEERETVGDSPC